MLLTRDVHLNKITKHLARCKMWNPYLINSLDLKTKFPSNIAKVASLTTRVCANYDIYMLVSDDGTTIVEVTFVCRHVMEYVITSVQLSWSNRINTNS